MQENYLAKWLNNELSELELAEFKKTPEYAAYKKIADASANLEAPEFSIDNAWDVFKNRNIEQQKVRTLHPFRPFLRVAAVIALLLGGAYFYLNSQESTFNAALAEQTSVTLPDTSEVLLNADSQLSFNQKKWDNQRNVKLNGEAFFKVAKGKKFTVATNQGTVTVLGTQFNVESRANFFEVTCYEGLVSVTYKDKEQKLPAGSSFVIISGNMQPTEIINTATPSWVQNESSFKSIPLYYVFAELERQFNISVNTTNIDTQQLFTGTFNNTDLHLALESISTPSQIRYKLEKDKVLFYAENTP